MGSFTFQDQVHLIIFLLYDLNSQSRWTLLSESCECLKQGAKIRLDFDPAHLTALENVKEGKHLDFYQCFITVKTFLPDYHSFVFLFFYCFPQLNIFCELIKTLFYDYETVWAGNYRDFL